MPEELAGDAVPVYDVVGVGFGPSNLALAIAIAEQNERAGGVGPVTSLFFERQHEFGWHRGMLIDDATMQVSFLKDLVTMRNPTSDFSFLSYLHGADRLVGLHQPEVAVPAADRVPRLPGMGGRPDRPTRSATGTR